MAAKTTQCLKSRPSDPSVVEIMNTSPVRIPLITQDCRCVQRNSNQLRLQHPVRRQLHLPVMDDNAFMCGASQILGGLTGPLALVPRIVQG